MSVWRIVLHLLAAVMVISSVALVFLSSFNMGNFMVWLLTVLVVVYDIWQKPLHAWFQTGAGRVVFWVLFALAAAYAAVLVFIGVSAYANPPTGSEQVVIVLGAGLRGDTPSALLKSRLDKAYEYAAAHPDVLVITSGGQGLNEWVPEGQAMRDYLIEKGLDEHRVIAENASTSTEENFAFSLALLKARGYTEDTPIVYVTNAFHCYRAGKYAAMAGFTSACALPAATPLRSIVPCCLREVLALVYYWMFKTSTSGPMHALVGFLNLNKNFFYKR